MASNTRNHKTEIKVGDKKVIIQPNTVDSAIAAAKRVAWKDVYIPSDLRKMIEVKTDENGNPIIVGKKKKGAPPPPLKLDDSTSYKLAIFMYDGKYEIIPSGSIHLGKYKNDKGIHVGERFLIPNKKIKKN